MRRSTRITLLILTLVVCFTGTSFAKEKGKAAAGEFDFAKTKAFMQEMDTRPDFPVGMVLANDWVYSLRALGTKIDVGRQNAIIVWMKMAQQKNGGFGLDKSGQDVSILNTSLALETLSYLDAVNAIDQKKVKSFVASLKNADGGFGFAPDSKGSALASTYFAVRVLKAVKGLDVVDKAKTTAYVKTFEKKEGGFGTSIGNGIPDAKNSYMATFILETIGSLNDATRAATLKYLGTTPYAVGKKGTERPTLDEQLYAVMALKALNAADRIDKAFALSFLKRLYIKQNGGFGPLEGYGSSPDSTTAGLRVLVEIGKLKAPSVKSK